LVAPIRTPRLILRRVDARIQSVAVWRDGTAAGESFAVVDRRTGVVIGAAGYATLAGRPGAIAVHIRIWGADEGHAHDAEATSAVVDRAFCETGASHLRFGSRAGDADARRVAEACGFRAEDGDGAFVLDRRDWAALAVDGAPGRIGRASISHVSA